MKYVVGFLFDNDHRVLLIKKKRPAWQIGKLNGVGGKIEEGETPSDAIRREFLEETGSDIYVWRYFCRIRFPGGAVFFFRSNQVPSVKPMSKTDEKLRWVKIARIKNYDIIPNVAWLIPMAMSFVRGERCCIFDIEEMFLK